MKDLLRKAAKELFITPGYYGALTAVGLNSWSKSITDPWVIFEYVLLATGLVYILLVFSLWVVLKIKNGDKRLNKLKEENKKLRAENLREDIRNLGNSMNWSTEETEKMINDLVDDPSKILMGEEYEQALKEMAKKHGMTVEEFKRTLP